MKHTTEEATLDAYFAFLASLYKNVETYSKFDGIVRDVFTPEKLGMTHEEFDLTISKYGATLV